MEKAGSAPKLSVEINHPTPGGDAQEITPIKVETKDLGIFYG